MTCGHVTRTQLFVSGRVSTGGSKEFFSSTSKGLRLVALRVFSGRSPSLQQALATLFGLGAPKLFAEEIAQVPSMPLTKWK